MFIFDSDRTCNNLVTLRDSVLLGELHDFSYMIRVILRNGSSKVQTKVQTKCHARVFNCFGSVCSCFTVVTDV